ncbi:MalY/PatB family protein [Salana multivorans]
MTLPAAPAVDAGGFDAALTDATTAEELRRRGSLKWTAFPGSIGAWVAEMDFLPAARVRAALTDAVNMGAYGYISPVLATRARQAASDWYARECGWEVPPASIHLVPDVLQGLRVALDHIAGAGSVAVVTTPAYMPFLTRPQAVGHDVVLAEAMVDDDGVWRHDLEALDAALAEASERSRAVEARALLVLCNPWNPVGRVLTREELLAIAEVVNRHDALVFSDEIHAPLRFGGLPHVPYASVDERAAAHTVTAVSASKTWNLAGLKCAQLFASAPELAEALRQPAALAGLEPSTVGVLANAVAFEVGEPWRAAVLDYLDGNRDAFAAAMARIAGARHTPPEGTYLAWVDLREARTAAGEALPEDLGTFFREEAGVALTDGALCGAPGFVRVNLATPRPILEELAAAIAQPLT